MTSLIFLYFHPTLNSAGNEFPLTGRWNASAIQSVEEKPIDGLLSDEELFGSREVYLEALEILASKGSFEREKVAVFGGKFTTVFKTHPSIKNPWTDVSIRSIETVNYDIVDLSHPMQGNRMDGNHHEAAVLVRIWRILAHDKFDLRVFCFFSLCLIHLCGTLFLINNRNFPFRTTFHTAEYSIMRFPVLSSHTEEVVTRLFP